MDGLVREVKVCASSSKHDLEVNVIGHMIIFLVFLLLLATGS